jgi:plastocyanin
MARLPIITNLRIVPRDGDFLNRKTGSRGEIYFDQDNNTLRAYDGKATGGYEMLTQERLKGVASYEYDVTVLNQGAGNKYVYNGDYYIDLTFIIGYTYIFNQNHPTNVWYPNPTGTTNNQHPLNFSEDNQNGELGGGTVYTDGVVYKINNTSVTKAQYWEQFETATQRSVQITVTNDTPSTLYIWCQNHLNMGRTATVVDPGTGSGGGGAGSIVVAADDSTQVVVGEGNTLQFAGGAGISTASSPDGIITITGTNSFRRFSVGGQSPVDATEPLDTITFTAGSNMIINTDPSTQSIVFNSTGSGGGGGGNSFGIIRVQGETDVVAEQTEDILTLSAGIGISILTNAGTDTVTITNTSAGVNDFDELSEPAQSSHTFDKIYLPAITMLTVTAVGTTAYLYDQYAGNNPTIYAINGTTIAFNLQASGHPFAIQTGAGVNFNEGLIHVSPNGQVNTGAAAQGFGTGTLYWKIPSSVTGGYRYQCTAHAPMVGSIVVKNFGSI